MKSLSAEKRGWYEVFFLLLNDVQQDLALWLRWVVVAPRDRRHSPTAAVWGIASRRGRPAIAVREEFPIGQWADQLLTSVGTDGKIGESLHWQLSWLDHHTPEYLYPHTWMYRAPWPKTKYAAPMPALRISGEIGIGTDHYHLNAVPGYVGHLWGTQMAEAWAWLQCDTFADAPGARLEALSARVKVGPIITRPLTLATLHLDNQTYTFNRLRHWCAATEWSAAGWRMETVDQRYRLHVECDAPKSEVSGLTYLAPDSSRRYCYHTDFADVRVELAERRGGAWCVLHQFHARHSARFETVSRAPNPLLPLFV